MHALVASGNNAIARDPHVVARGGAVVAGWSELPAGPGEPVFKLRRATVK